MTNILPVIGSSGYYAFLPPFDTASINNVEYTCKAIRQISDYLANNEPVQADIYTANNIAEEIWEDDVKSDAHIVSLQSRSGHWLYVPVRFIQSYPSGNGVPYRTMMIGISLPSIPVDQDLSSVKAEIKDLVDASLGLNCIVKQVETSRPVLVTNEVHLQTQQERAMQSMGQGTMIARLRASNAQVEQLLAKVQALEAYILEHHTTAP